MLEVIKRYQYLFITLQVKIRLIIAVMLKARNIKIPVLQDYRTTVLFMWKRQHEFIEQTACRQSHNAPLAHFEL